MPLYDYLCTDCGHTHEALQKMSDAILKTCPSCQKDTLQKAVTAPNFRLSGSGWYETDFKKDGQKNLATKDDTSSEKPADKDKAPKDKTKTETKSSDKANTKTD